MFQEHEKKLFFELCHSVLLKKVIDKEVFIHRRKKKLEYVSKG